MKAKKFDSDFDDDKDISHALDVSNVRRPLQEQRRVILSNQLRIPHPEVDESERLNACL